jgi:hypothetical protein
MNGRRAPDIMVFGDACAIGAAESCVRDLGGFLSIMFRNIRELRSSRCSAMRSTFNFGGEIMFRTSRITARLRAALDGVWSYAAAAQALRGKSNRPGAKLLLAGCLMLVANSSGFAQGPNGPGASQAQRPDVRLESFLRDSAQRYINNAVDAINRCSVSDFTDAIHGLDSVISALRSDLKDPEANYYRNVTDARYRIPEDKRDIDSLRHLIVELNKTARLRWPACREQQQPQTLPVTDHGPDSDDIGYKIQRVLAFLLTGVVSPALGVNEREISASENQGNIDPFQGLNLGLFVSGGRSQATFVETLAATGEQTSKDSFGDTRIGGGVTIATDFCVAGNGFVRDSADGGFLPSGGGCLVASPFIQIEDPNTSARFGFPGGSFIGVESNFEVTGGIKIGPRFVGPAGGTFSVYGLVGLSEESAKYTVNFVPISSSETKFIPGLTAGFGVAFAPAGFRLFGMPATLSLEYQHTFWQTAHFNMPASSPSFNYAFPREDDKVLAGLHVAIANWSPVPAIPPRRR